MSHDYELEQSNLKSMAEVLRKELKQQEQQKTNAKAFVAAVKKYTDMQELDAAVLREFIVPHRSVPRRQEIQDKGDHHCL